MSINKNSPFKIGMVYKTIGGQDVIIIGESNAEGSFHYHTVIGHDQKHRYTRKGETECGRCTGSKVDDPDNLVPDTGRELHELGAKFAWDNWLKPLFEATHVICEIAGLSFIAGIHVPTEDEPGCCVGYVSLKDDAPDTMQEILALMQSRPVTDSLQEPDSSCDN